MEFFSPMLANGKRYVVLQTKSKEKKDIGLVDQDGNEYIM